MTGGPIPRHPRVRIHYRRLPDRETIFDQRVVLERDDVIVTLAEPLPLDEPMIHDGRVMLEPGSLALWFTFPGAWHDIAWFHAADGRRTGLYANVLTPPELDGPVWRTTDLFLDLWWPTDGEPEILDEDELDRAIGDQAIDGDVAERARAEARALLDGAGRSVWPPAVVGEWSLERALAELERRGAGSAS